MFNLHSENSSSNMLKRILYFISILLFAVACKKEVPLLPEENEPQFEIKGTFGTDNIHWKAGDDNFIFSTENKLLNGIPFYSGLISNGETHLELGVLQGNPDLETSLSELIDQVTSIQFAHKNTQPLFAISKDKFTNNSLIESVDWYVDGVFKSTNTLNINDPGKYEICAQVLFYNGTQKSLCNSVTLGYQLNGDFKICYLMGSNSKLKAWISDSSQSIEKIEWYKDDIKTSENSFVEIPLETSHKISAKVTFTNGVTKTRNFVMDAENQGRYIEDFSAIKFNNSTKWDYKTILNLKHDGQYYSSLTTSNGEKTIQVNSIEFYGIDNQGKKIYRVNGTLECDMKNTSSGEVKLLKLDIKFGITLD